MRHRWISSMAAQLSIRRTGIILTLAAALSLSSGLIAQQPPTSAQPGQATKNEAVTESQQTQDNLPPSPDQEGVAPSPGEAVPPPAASAPVPPSLSIPAGTLVTVRLLGGLSSDVNQQGDSFSATLEQPIVVDGWVVARRGQIANGRVVSVQKAGRVKGVSFLGVALSDLPMVDGREKQVTSQLVQTSAGPSKGRDAAGIATTTGLGAAIGGAVDGEAGAGIGAAAGAVAGVAGVLLTPGRPTVMPPETLLTFRLQEPVTINTQQSARAFQPVKQQDYASARPQFQYRPPGPPYPPPPGPAYPYAYPYPYTYPYPYAVAPYWGGWGFYPSVSIGYYGGYGWGHGGRWH